MVSESALHHSECKSVRHVKVFRHAEHKVRDRILQLITAHEFCIGHADLFALVDERCAPAQECDHRQECGRLVSVLLCVDAEPADAPRLVMVLEHQCVPACSVVSELRVYEAALELLKAERLRYHLETEDIVRGKMLKVEDRIELAGLLFYISVRVLFVRYVGLAYRICVVERKCVPVEFIQEFVHAGAVHVEWGALLEVQRVLVVAQRVYLRDHVENIEAESVDALVEPEAEYVCHLLADLRVLPVEIRLLRRKEMQVVLVCSFDALPRRARER